MCASGFAPASAASAARRKLSSEAGRPESALEGRPASEETFREAAERALKGARPLAHNAYKVELGKRAVVRALMRAARLA